MGFDSDLIHIPPGGAQLQAELRRLRGETERRYTEVDLLVAALREHIADLRSERDHLRGEVDRLHARLAALEHREQVMPWLLRGSKGNH
jgi:chromosome segregation ATPase